MIRNNLFQGLKKSSNGVLMKATFEETSEVLHNGARFAQRDNLTGVSEAIIVGDIPPIGTGKIGVFLDSEAISRAKTYPKGI
jgi:DNA-directed RNA polymerase II subunit RPB1